MPPSSDTALSVADRAPDERPSDLSITTTPALAGLIAAISTPRTFRLGNVYVTRHVVIVLLMPVDPSSWHPRTRPSP